MSDMETIVTAEEILALAAKEDWDGGIILVGFKNGEAVRYMSDIKDRYQAVGHLVDLTQYLLSEDGDDD